MWGMKSLAGIVATMETTIKHFNMERFIGRDRFGNAIYSNKEPKPTKTKKKDNTKQPKAGQGYKKHWKSPTPLKMIEVGYNSVDRKPSVAEDKLAGILTDLGVEFKREITFKALRNKEGKQYLVFDFYIPLFNVAIEYDGGAYHNNNFNDEIKNRFCRRFGITLLRYNKESWHRLERAVEEDLKKYLVFL
jgi:very-short-patch-repair endonuclease